MNRIILKGRITADIELNATESGVSYCSFTVAVDRYMGKDKERQTDFIPCKAWRTQAEVISKYFGKGDEILLEGELHIDKYEKDGERRSYTYVTVSKPEFSGGKRTENTEAKPEMQAIPDEDALPF